MKQIKQTWLTYSNINQLRDKQNEQQVDGTKTNVTLTEKAYKIAIDVEKVTHDLVQLFRLPTNYNR